MIPDFDERGNLKPGIWVATIEEIGERFAQTAPRQKLFQAFVALVEILCRSKCSEVYLDGSFITSKAEPFDYDLCYEPIDMQPTQEWRQLLNMTVEERKNKHLGDIFIHMPSPPFFTDYVEFWQTDRDDNVKGIIRIKLRLQAND